MYYKKCVVEGSKIYMWERLVTEEEFLNNTFITPTLNKLTGIHLISIVLFSLVGGYVTYPNEAIWAIRLYLLFGMSVILLLMSVEIIYLRTGVKRFRLSEYITYLRTDENRFFKYLICRRPSLSLLLSYVYFFALGVR